MSEAARKVVVEPGRITVIEPELCAEFEVYGEAPVQGFGTVLGRDVYFRSRNDHWSFEVADEQGRLPSDGQAEGGFYRESAYPNASYMPLDRAVCIIERSLREFLEP
jgi:hypothetical protein